MKNNYPNLAKLVDVYHEKTTVDAPTGLAREFAERRAVDDVFASVIGLYGAIKATEIHCPRLVIGMLPEVERSIEAYSKVLEIPMKDEVCDE